MAEGKDQLYQGAVVFCIILSRKAEYEVFACFTRISYKSGMHWRSLAALWACLSTLILTASEIRPLPSAHAHNDYEHTRPLMDALEQGFCSVEADVHLSGGKLLIGHDPEDLQMDRTLEALYLRPLKERVDKYGGVYPTRTRFILLVDIKTEAESTYSALKKLLKDYSEMLTEYREDGTDTNAVTLIVSGNRPRDTMISEKARFAAYDGRLSDLGQQTSVHFMPLVSDNWRNHFTWRGEGEFPESEREKLHAIVRRVHAEGRMIRFWASPDNAEGWRFLRDAGVDLINTDRLAGLAEFLNAPQ